MQEAGFSSIRIPNYDELKLIVIAFFFHFCNLILIFFNFGIRMQFYEQALHFCKGSQLILLTFFPLRL